MQPIVIIGSGLAGFNTVKEFRKLDKDTPIVMLTTESEQGKKAEGQAAGAKAWIVKPFQPQQLLTAVDKLVG